MPEWSPAPIQPTWEGLPIIFTKHAASAAQLLGMDIYDIAVLLEGGQDCEEGPRRYGIRERCSKWRGRWVRIVVSREQSGWIEDKYAWIVMNVKPVTQP